MRARNLKPGFFKNEDLADIEPLGRLLFQGLWCMADREGRLEDRPKRIKAEVLPYDDEVNVNELLEKLAQKKFLVRYENDGTKYIQIINFSKHQDPHYKEAPSEIPAPEGYEKSLRISPALNNSQKEEIYLRDGKKCANCKTTKNLTIDHVIPLSLGGDNNPNNLQVLCKSCNASKNNRIISNQLRPKVDPTSTCDCPLIPDSPFLTPDSLNPSTSSSPPPKAPVMDNGFVLFWKEYPRKIGKQAALKAWQKLRKAKVLPPIEKILEAVREQTSSDQWTKDDGQFIPHPATWLNQGRWEDEPTKILSGAERWLQQRSSLDS